MQSERLEQCPHDENKWSNPLRAPSIHDGELRSFLSNRFDRYADKAVELPGSDPRHHEERAPEKPEEST